MYVTYQHPLTVRYEVKYVTVNACTKRKICHYEDHTFSECSCVCVFGAVPAQQADRITYVIYKIFSLLHVRSQTLQKYSDFVSLIYSSFINGITGVFYFTQVSSQCVKCNVCIKNCEMPTPFLLVVECMIHYHNTVLVSLAELHIQFRLHQTIIKQVKW